MSNTTNEKTAKAAGRMTGLLTGWGIPGTIARILAGAIIGAVTTAYTLTGGGGPASYSQAADGSVNDKHELTLPLPDMTPPAQAQPGKVDTTTK